MSIKKKLSGNNRGKLFISIIVFYFLTFTATTVPAQNSNTHSQLIRFLKNQYQKKFNSINLDTFLIDYSNTLNITRFIDRFVMFNTIHIGTSYNNQLEKRFNNVDLAGAIKENLSANFFNVLLNSKEKNTQVLYLILASAISDTAKIIDYIDNYVNVKTEREAKALLNNMYGYKGVFYNGKIKSVLLNQNNKYFFDYPLEYITPKTGSQISNYIENDGLTPGHEIDYFVYYKQKYQAVNSQELFIKEYESCYDLFHKAVTIDIGLAKEFSFLPIIHELFKDEYLSSKIKLSVLSYELSKEHSAEDSAKLTDSLIGLYEKYCKLYSSNKPYLNKPVKNSRLPTSFNMHVSIIQMLCSIKNKVNDSLLNNLQLKLQYDWVLFYNIVKYQCKVNDSFFYKHIGILHNAANGLMEKKSSVTILDTVTNTINRSTDINKYFPVNNHSPYYYDIPALREQDDFFKKLITTPECFSLTEKFILSNKNLNDSLHIYPLETINKLIESTNPINMAYGYQYLFTKNPSIIAKVLHMGNTAYKQKWVYYMASLFNYTDKKNLLAKYFNNNFTAGFSKQICIDKFENATFIHTALTYFKNKESKVFYSALKKVIGDTTNCIKTNMFILNSYPYLFYDKGMNEETKRWYFKEIYSYIKRKEWIDFFSYLSENDLSRIRKILLVN